MALGIARASIDDFVAIAKGKVPRFSSASLRERPLAQQAVAGAEARLRGVAPHQLGDAGRVLLGLLPEGIMLNLV